MKHFGVALVTALTSAALLLLLLGWFAPGQAELRSVQAQLARDQALALAPLWLSVKRIAAVTTGILLASAAAIALSSALVVLSSIAAGRQALALRARLVYPRRHGALYPGLAAPDARGVIRILPPVNEPGAQRVAALTTGLAPDARLNGAAVRQVLRPDDPQAMLPAPSPEPSVTLDDVLSADPQHHPHWLLVGETGAGKSSAAYLILAALRRRLVSEYIICERDGINWNSQAAASTLDGYAAALDAVEVERQRRAELLRAADVDHISRLPAPPPYLVLLIEEAESVYAALALHSRPLALRYKTVVRDLAAMGRKEGILLMLCTQTGTSEVFDIPTRKNLANKLFFRSEPAVGDTWGIPREIGLSRLPTGTAYSLRHGGVISFPPSPRPSLPLSRLYRETRPPSGTAGTVLEPEPTPVHYACTPPGPGTVLEPEPGWRPGRPPAAPVLRIPDRRRPTPAEAAAMREHYRRTHSQTAVCTAFYGYKNGDVWDWVTAALRGEL